jgi:hypothetical protein
LGSIVSTSRLERASLQDISVYLPTQIHAVMVVVAVECGSQIKNETWRGICCYQCYCLASKCKYKFRPSFLSFLPVFDMTLELIFSAPLRYSEAIDYLYSPNKCVASDADARKYLSLVLLPQRIDAISSLTFYLASSKQIPTPRQGERGSVSSILRDWGRWIPRETAPSHLE